MNRRTFFQATLLTVGAVVGYSALARAEERRRGGSPSGAAAGAAGAAALVSPQDAAAKGVNYVELNTNMKDVKLQTDRSGVKFKDQHCKACAFYQKDKETKVSGKTAAPCQMPFATGKYVSSEGWCTSWAKKS